MAEVEHTIAALLTEKRVFEETTVEHLAKRHRRAAPDRPIFAPSELLSRLS